MDAGQCLGHDQSLAVTFGFEPERGVYLELRISKLLTVNELATDCIFVCWPRATRTFRCISHISQAITAVREPTPETKHFTSSSASLLEHQYQSTQDNVKTDNLPAEMYVVLRLWLTLEHQACFSPAKASKAKEVARSISVAVQPPCIVPNAFSISLATL